MRKSSQEMSLCEESNRYQYNVRQDETDDGMQGTRAGIVVTRRTRMLSDVWLAGLPGGRCRHQKCVLGQGRNVGLRVMMAGRDRSGEMLWACCLPAYSPRN